MALLGLTSRLVVAIVNQKMVETMRMCKVFPTLKFPLAASISSVLKT